jgi:hypothetical protein
VFKVILVLPDLLVLQARPDRQVLQVYKVTPAQRDLQALLALPDLLDLKAYKEIQALPDLLDLQGQPA